MHVVIRGAGGSLALVHHGGFQIRQTDLGCAQMLLHLDAHLAHLVARRASGRLEQFFRIRHHLFEIGNQLFLAHLAHFAHLRAPRYRWMQ